MKFKKLLSVATLFVTGALGFNANAQYTVDDLTSSGWTEVSELPKSNAELSKNYYVFYATEANLMLAEEKGSFTGDGQEGQLTGVYRTPADPKKNNKFAWILEYREGNFYGIRNLSNPNLLVQTRENATWRVQAAWERIQSIWTQWDIIEEDPENNKFAIKNELPANKGGNSSIYIGPWMEDAQRFTDNNVVAGNKSNANAGRFKIYSISRLTYDNISYNYEAATKDNPLDVTGLIPNASFDYTAAWWDRTGSWGNNQSGDVKTLESWNSNNYTIKQTLSGIPNGLYRLTVDVISGNDVYNAYVYAEGESFVKGETVKAKSSKGDYGTMSSEVAGNTLTVKDIVVDNNTLTVGVKDPSTGNGWTVIDNFKLYYYGEQVDLSVYIEAYDKALNAANEYTSAEMSDFALSALNTAITNNTIADPENSTQKVLEAATTNLNIAVESAKVAVSCWTLVKSGEIPTNNAAGWAISTKNGGLACNTWSTEGNSDGSGMTTPFIQDHIGAGTPLAGGEAGGKLYYTLEGLVPGTKYSVSALVRAFNESATGVEGASFFVGSDKKSIDEYGSSCIGNFAVKGKFGNFTCTGEVDAEGKLVFGIELESSSAINWVAIKNVTIKESSGVVPTAITMDYNNLSLTTGGTVRFTATITPNDAEDKTIVWTSSDPTIATVSGGVVTGLKPGNVTITAKASAGNNVTATATVIVVNAPKPDFYSEIADGDFYIVNAATGLYLGGANDWGTQASLILHGIPFTVKNEGEGIYTLDSHTSNGGDNHYLGSNGYIDSPAANLHIKSIGDSKYTISTGENNGYLTVTAPSNVVNISGTSSDSPLAQWYFVSKDDRIKTFVNASKDNPVDATFYIEEANLSRNLKGSNDVSGWTGTVNYGGDNTNLNAQFYQSAGNVYQTITVPNGTYVVKCQGFYTNNNSNPTYLYANNEQVALNILDDSGITSQSNASTAFTNGRYKNSLTVTVTDHNLTIGVKSETTDNWTVWDNFELYYYGTEVKIAVKANKYSTFIAPFDVTIPEGVTASKVTGTEGEILVFEGLEETIPANTPVVLYSENGCEETSIGADLSTDVTYTVGLLTGTYEESTTVPAGSYVLQTQDNGQKFYLVGEDTKFKMPNRAYLTVDNAAGVKAFSFGGETTGINGIGTLTDGTVESIYTINGTRVNSLQKGLNIVKMSNGKTQKVLVK